VGSTPRDRTARGGGQKDSAQLLSPGEIVEMWVKISPRPRQSSAGHSPG